MNYAETAQGVLQAIGGPSNVKSVIHCSTRLRFVLADTSKVNQAALKKVPGVLGITEGGGQFQVIIGNEVVEVFDEINKLVGSTGSKAVTTAEQAPAKMTLKHAGEVFMDFLISIFQPLIPAISGGGVLIALLTLFTTFGLLDKSSGVYTVLNYAGKSALYFLPILIGITTANKLKVNPIVATVVVGALLHPDLMSAIQDGTDFLGLPINSDVTYGSQVFPAILTVLFYAMLEKFLMPRVPKAIRTFFVPMVCIAVTVPVALLFLGPIGYEFGVGFASAILALYNSVGWVAVAILAGLLPFLISVGMHKALIPYATTTFGTVGNEPFYGPAQLAHNIAESGACFGVALKTRDTHMRSVASSAAVSALCGITEPALYGVTLQNKKVLVNVVVSSFVSGAVLGLFHVTRFVMATPSLLSLPTFIDENNPMNFIGALLGFAIALVMPFVISLITWKDTDPESATEQDISHEFAGDGSESVDRPKVAGKLVEAPAAGKLESLSEVNDAAFSSGVLGKGFAVVPTEGLVTAPVDGKVAVLYPTNHALVINAENDQKVLVHIGLDTVNLEGKYFTPLVKVGDQVKAGDRLMEFDLGKVVSAGFDPTVVTTVMDE